MLQTKEYSDKSFVFYSENLAELETLVGYLDVPPFYGKLVRNLKFEPWSGWVFSKKHQNTMLEWLQKYNNGHTHTHTHTHSPSNIGSQLPVIGHSFTFNFYNPDGTNSTVSGKVTGVTSEGNLTAEISGQKVTLMATWQVANFQTTHSIKM